MEVSGIVKRIGGVQEVSAKFRKREIVVTTEEQYPQHISIEFVQDKTALLDGFQEGEKVSIGINIRGREWTSPQGEVKFFNTINGWKIDKMNAAPAPSNPSDNMGQAPAASTSFGNAPTMAPLGNDTEDDLPF
jgi:single-strand DNA-binding protein